MDICPACRTPAAPGTRYCPSCGTTLTGTPPPPVAYAVAPARPTGVTILAVLCWIIAGGMLLFAVAALMFGFIMGSVIGGFAGDGAAGAALGSAIALVISSVVGVFGVLYLVLGFGMWNGRPWAWVLGLVLAVLGILGGLGGFAAVAMPGVMGPAEMMLSGLPQLLLSGFVLWYFLQPGVKTWFKQS